MTSDAVSLNFRQLFLDSKPNDDDDDDDVLLGVTTQKKNVIFSER
jgi:hypothetical protein